MREYGPESAAIEGCPTLLRQTADKYPVTDDNMGTEWRYYLSSE
jgi:spermidine synthase